MKAVIAAINVIKLIDNNVRFINSDPIMYRLPKKPTTPLKEEYAAYFRKTCFQTWDMISGLLFPELGGSLEHLDIVGINYYIQNQEYICDVKKEGDSFFPTHQTIPFKSKNRAPFYNLYLLAYLRYQRPLMISETGSFGELRYGWWKTILKEIHKILENKLPMLGVCAYPIIDRFDWTTGLRTNSGFWDFLENDDRLLRHPHPQIIKIVRNFQTKITSK